MHAFLYVFYVLHALRMFITWPNTPVTPKATLRVPVPSSLQTKERKHTHTHEHTQTGSEIDFAYALRESGKRTLTPLEPTTDEVDGHELLLVLVVILIVHKPNGKLSVLRARGQHHRIMYIIFMHRKREITETSSAFKSAQNCGKIAAVSSAFE